MSLRLPFPPPTLSRYGIRSLDGVTPADSPENRRMAARFILTFTISAAVIGSVAGVASLVSGDRYTKHPVGILLVAVVVGIFGLIEARGVIHWLGITMVHVVVVSAVAIIVFGGGLVVGKSSSFLLATAACTIVMAAVAMACTVRTTVAYLGFVGVAYAVFLVLQPHPAPVAEIWAVVGSSVIVARLVIWLVNLAVRRSDLDRHARQELEVVSNRQTAFLGNMSHELRTPLNAIIGFSDLLATGVGGVLNERQSEYVEDVRSSGEHLLALIDDVLDLAKVEEGRTELSIAEVDVSSLVATSAALFREQAGRHRISIEVETADVVRIDADERKVRQVIYNLLSNAVRFTPDGGAVWIRVESVPGAVAIAVADSGPGIAPDQRERIFEEYHQSAPSAAARQPGTGLGLALVRKFVELHGGHITVDSELGAGATFTMTLPATPDLEGCATPAEPAAAQRRWTDYFRVRSIEGDSAADSPENRQRVAQLVMKIVMPAIVVLTGSELLFMPVTHDPRYHPVGVLVVAWSGLLAAFVFDRNAHHIPLAAAHPIAVTTTLMVTLGSYFAGAKHPEVAFGYVAFGIVSYAVFEIGGALMQTAIIGVVYGYLLHIQPGNFNPLGRWLVVVPAATVASLAVLWLVSEMARLAASERRTKAQLEIVSRHKSEFLANMSHELRTPLNAIIGFSEVLRDELFGPLTPKQQEYVGDILVAGMHLLAVINDILDLAKLEAGRMPSDARVVTLAPVLEGVARRRRLAVTCRGDASVVADEGQLIQLLDNLVAASPGAERLEVNVDDGTVRVRVQRDGPPLFTDATQAFEEFHRGTREGGTGLELPLARALADLHRGRLQLADSKELELVLPRA